MKIFCIGRNKTGTTSLKSSLKELGFKVGSQRKGEVLIREWHQNNFKPIIELAKTADAFQDIPFSYPDTYKHLDKNFPNSKFILSIRNSPEEWYNSVVRFHSEVFGRGNKPTVKQLKNARWVWKGWIYEAMYNLYNTPPDDPYNKEILINHYIEYNNQVIEYFKDRPNDLLIINLSDSDSYQKFYSFLGVEPKRSTFPHLLRTK